MGTNSGGKEINCNLKSDGACALCGGSQRKTLYQGLTDLWLGSPGKWTLVICEACDLIYLSPSPTAEELDRAYLNYFTHRPPDNSPAKEVLERSESSFVSKAKRVYRWALRPIDHRLNEMSNMYLSALKPGRLLDVGCGNGLFLKRMSDLGWIAQGVETDARSAKIAKEAYGFEIHAGTLETAGFLKNHFDAITMSHVIEHLRNPQLVLAECRRILKPGGTLVVTTPNFRCFGRRCFGKKWLGWDPPRHLLLFSRKSLQLIAQKAGFSQPETHTSAVRANALFNDMVRFQKHQLEGPLKKSWYVYSQAFRLMELAVGLILPDAGEDLVLRVRK